MQALELQQRLTSVELQLHEEEVLVQKINSLERDNRDLSESLSALREKQHEEKTTRWTSRHYCTKHTRKTLERMPPMLSFKQS